MNPVLLQVKKIINKKKTACKMKVKKNKTIVTKVAIVVNQIRVKNVQ
jgi:hypothetical protein